MESSMLYHGSFAEIKLPMMFEHYHHTMDFGFGFYLTDLKYQAEIWARRKYDIAKRTNPDAKAVVNVYYLDREKVLKEFKCLFLQQNDDWLDMIASCRDKKNQENQITPHNYDLVNGPMADDQIYNYVEAYLTKEITREEFWERAKFNHKTNQTMIRNKALECLQFIRSYEVEAEI